MGLSSSLAAQPLTSIELPYRICAVRENRLFIVHLRLGRAMGCVLNMHVGNTAHKDNAETQKTEQKSKRRKRA
jgi:hypothetical protein